LNGWSTGGLATIAFQEALEAEGVKIDGVSTAATPSDLEMFVNRMIFNPRPYSDTTVPDGPWNVAIPQLAAFSLGAYGRKPGAALELFGGNYDFARKFFMREFEALPEFTFQEDIRNDRVPVMTMDGVTRSAAPAQFIAERFRQDAGAFSTTAFAGLVRDASTGNTRLDSDMRTYYGLADEVVPESVATILDTWQQDTFGKTNLELVPLDDASHRGTLLNAAFSQLRWFDIQRGAIPSGLVGAVNPVTRVPAAVENLTVTPVGIGEVALQWSPSAGATRYDVSINGQYRISVVGQPIAFFRDLSPLTAYTFSIVPKNTSGSGPETTVAFGAATVTLDTRENLYPAAIIGSQDGSVWFASNEGKDVTRGGWVHRIVNVGGTWSNSYETAVKVDVLPRALTIGLDGSVWVASQPGYMESGPGFVRHIVKGTNGEWSVEGEPIYVDQKPSALTTGLDGAIWVASENYGTVQRIVRGQDGKWFVEGKAINVDSSPIALTTGRDGAIWVASKNYGTVQRIVKGQDGTWFVEGNAIKVDSSPMALTTGRDGSIWVACRPSTSTGSVQRIVNENQSWIVRGEAIRVESKPSSLTTALDGGIWVGYEDGITFATRIENSWTQPSRIDFQTRADRNFSNITTASDGSIWASSDRFTHTKQTWTIPVSPTDVTAVADPAAGKATLSWKTPATNGGTPVTSYTLTASQGPTSTVRKNWADTSFTFSELDFSKGPIYFTVAANNFVGTGPVATLLMGPDGKPIDTTHLSTGITTDGTLVLGGGFDTLGNGYSWQALGSGAAVDDGKAEFTFGLPNQPQTIVAAGQEIAVIQGAYGSVNLAGAAVFGAQLNQAIKLNFTDGTSTTWTQSFSDWAAPQQYNGETTLVTSQYRNQGDGVRDSRSVSLYGYSRVIPQGKALKSITLPTNQNVRILDITMGA
jgi:hypothetical protein